MHNEILRGYSQRKERDLEEIIFCLLCFFCFFFFFLKASPFISIEKKIPFILTNEKDTLSNTQENKFWDIFTEVNLKHRTL